MKRRIALFITLLVLGGIAWWLATQGPTTTLAKPLSDFAVADTSAVTRIYIHDRQGKAVDLRRKGGTWVLDGRHTVRQELINTALKTFLRIEVKSPVPKSMEDMVLRTMASASCMVEIYMGDDEPVKSWIIGHATRDHFGTYMVLEKQDAGRSNAPFVMGLSGFTGVLNTRFPTDPDAWRNTAIFRYHDVFDLASVEVVHPASPGQSYRIINGADGQVSLTDLSGKALPTDTLFAKNALLAYKEFDWEYFERKMVGASRDSLLSAQPNFILRATPRSGATQTVKLWYMPYTGGATEFDTPQPLHDPLRMHALVQDTVLVVVQRQFTDRMTQPASALMR
ncbi:MAG: hypothetical protein IPL52_06555 [Flavobacteriales bacterium]|nr:hypothetical protein [Flavobacteriales bacterium]